MRIACPTCAAEYEVPDRLLAGAARSLRCSRCGADFVLPQVAPVVAAPPVPTPPPPPPPEPPEPPRAALPAEPAAAGAAPPALVVPERTPVATPAPGQAALLRAWAASLVVVLGGMLGLLVFRTQVMAAWPPATRLFAMLGLA